jgi:hypothetical protein
MRDARKGCEHVRVASITRKDIEAAVRAAWARDTCDPVDAVDWSAANPARGQCGTTALTINDLLGGELLVAVVLRAGRRDGGQPETGLWPGRARVDHINVRAGRTGNARFCRTWPKASSATGSRRSLCA